LKRKKSSFRKQVLDFSIKRKQMPFCFSVFFLVQCRYEMHPGNQLNDRFAQPDKQKQEEMNGIQ